MPILGTSQSKLYHVIVRRDNLLLESFDIHALLDVLPDIQVDRRRLQQVHDLLIVDLQEAALDEKLQGRAVGPLVDDGLLGFDALEDVLEGSLHDSSSLV